MKRRYTNIGSSRGLFSTILGLAALTSASSSNTIELNTSPREFQFDTTTNRRTQTSRHTKLSTLYSGTIESTHGVSFLLQNGAADSALIITGLGLNVQTSPTTFTGAGMVAGSQGPCRVKVYTRPVGGSYALALDTSSVTCMGPEEETYVSDEAFLRFYQEMYGGGGGRELRGEEEEESESEEGERRVQVTSDQYPLVIQPSSMLEVYVVVLPVYGDTSGIQPILLSSPGTTEGAMYANDKVLFLSEGSSVTNGYLVDAVANGGSDVDYPNELKPTVFNGAIYYDNLPASLTLSEYFKNLEYSLQPGASTLGYLGCDAQLNTGYMDSIGSYGVMFDVISLVSEEADEGAASMSQWMEIYGMDVYIRNMVETTFEIYVRSNGGAEYTSYYEQSGQTSINENWTLIAKGSVVGRGPDVGTPIPAEAWLKNIVLKPGDSVGFYVTVLDEPHLRYRKSDLAEGALFAEDGNLAIGVGRSWGQYPLAGDGSDTYFANREFSGSFKYHAHEGICQTSSPTQGATTFAPVAAPEGLCTGNRLLKSTFQDGTGSFGALFDVVGKVPEVTLRGIDLNMDWNNADQADVVVYARKGSWFGVQTDRASWPHLLVNTTIYKPADFPNREITGPYISIEHKMKSAIIPDWAFKPLTIQQGETWALYVLSSIPDLRYTFGTSIGQVFASSPEIDILEGAGAADYPAFLSGTPEVGGAEYTFYAPRVFNGNLRYDYFAECESEAPSTSPAPTPAILLKTSVKYMFYVEYGPEMVADNVPSDMERDVSRVLDGFLIDSDNDLNEMVQSDGFFISSVVASVVPPADLGYLCVPTPPNSCTPIAVEVEGSHMSSASTEQVAYYLYRQASVLPSLIDVDGYKIVYIGKKAIETTNEITLSGVPGREMGEDEQAFFAQALQNFLSSQVTVDPDDEDGLKIVSVSINGQIIDTNGAALGGRRLSSSNVVSVNVQGQYKPPPEIDFGAIVEDSINSDPGRMTEELRNRPNLESDIEGASSANSYFEEADVVGSKEVKIETTIVLQDNTNPMKGTLNMMAGVVGVLIVGLSAAFFLRPHRRSAIFGSKSKDDEQLQTQLVDQENCMLDEKAAYRDAPY